MVSTTQLDIVNMALQALAQEPISDYYGSSRNAVAMRSFYNTSLQSVLEKVPWSFATKVLPLSPLSTTPSVTWSYMFSLPADYVKDQAVLDSQGDPREYEIREGTLYCNEQTIFFKYTFLNESTGAFTAEFTKAFYLQLAADAAYTVTKSNTTAAAAEQKAQAFLTECAHNDSKGTYQDMLEENYEYTSQWLKST